MRYFKMLGLLAATVTAMMGIAGTSWATVVTAPSGTTYTGPVEFESEGSVTLDGPTAVTCASSSLELAISSHGSGVTASGSLNSLQFSNCDEHVKVVKVGFAEIHSGSEGNGTFALKNSDITVEYTTIFGNLHCVYEADSSVTRGPLSAAPSSTGHASLSMSAPLELLSGSILCGSSAEWTGKYKVTTPTGLLVD